MNSISNLQNVESAISKQFELQDTLLSFCSEIRNALTITADDNHNNFSAIQLLNLDRSVIETNKGEFGDAIENQWNSIARHYVDTDNEETRDIQGDIVLSKNNPEIIIISGWNNKFDKWIYNEYKHEHYVRIWIPIIVLRNENGELITDWFTDIDKSIFDVEAKDEFDKIEQLDGLSKRIIIPIDNIDNIDVDIIGTVEAGYYKPKTNKIDLMNEIHLDLTHQLAMLTFSNAINIYQRTLAFVFDTITEEAKNCVNAASASLHFLRDDLNRKSTEDDEISFHLKSCSGKECNNFLKKCPIHAGGAGDTAMRSGVMEVRNQKQLSKKNPAVHRKGIKTMIAYPLNINKTINFSDTYVGVLYVHFSDENSLNTETLNIIKLFAEKAITAIKNSVNYVAMRESANKLQSFDTVSRLLAEQPLLGTLTFKIAGLAKNIMAADLVSIYEFNSEKSKFIIPCSTAGRLIDNNHTSRQKQPETNTGPWLIMFKSDIYLSPDSYGDEVMDNTSKKSFIKREKIVSSIGYKLRCGEEIVGVIFLHYRHKKSIISEKEREFIYSISSWAAIAIQHRRDFSALYNQLEINKRELKNGLSARIKENLRSSLSNSKIFTDHFNKNKNVKSFVMSIDIRKSTELMLKSISHDHYVDFIVELQKSIKRIILDNYGIIDKFTGDGMLVYFPEFYSGSDANKFCVLAAYKCHRAFKTIYAKYKKHFLIVLDVGFGIGIDYGEISLHIQDGDLIAVGPSIVYACRLSCADAGTTLVNQQAKDMLIRKLNRNSFSLERLTIEIKNEGNCTFDKLIITDENLNPSKPDLEQYGITQD